MENKEKIENFIKNNHLHFSGFGSDLNSDCTIISGFALFSGVEINELIDILSEQEEWSGEAEEELQRVFEFAENNNYGTFWSTEDAKKQYKF